MASTIDPDKGSFIFATGRKGSGKSVLCRRVFDSYPYDKLVIDPTGDVAKSLTNEGIEVQRWSADALPVRFPSHVDDESKPVTAVFVPDMGSPSAVDDMDRALGLVLAHKRSCCWIDEIGVMTKAQSTPPNLRRALHHGRHDQLTLITAGPRPVDIDPLVLAQSDFVAVFSLPNPRDRQRVADAIGWPPQRFAAAVNDLHGHEYLWYVAADHDLWHMPPLPPRVRRNVTEPIVMS